jgi:hypothetical protein
LLAYYKNKNNCSGVCKPKRYNEKLEFINKIEQKIEELTKEIL